MKIAVTGSSGLVGQALIDLLKTQGHEVIRIVRKAAPSSERTVLWDPEARTIDLNGLEGVEGVVHLAGESIVGRWTEVLKNKILKSRVEGTRWIAESIARMKNPPKVLVCASAIGFYGDRGQEALNESSSKGTGFLSDVCQAWEDAASPAKKAGIRTVHLRIGIILSKRGGALAKMMLPFKLGIGGILGDGKQFMSWIALEDVTGVILHALKNNSLEGAVNTVSPKPVANRDFTKALGKALHRPTLFPVPPFAIRSLFGEMADALLLASAQVYPKKLQESGYSFKYSELSSLFSSILYGARALSARSPIT